MFPARSTPNPYLTVSPYLTRDSRSLHDACRDRGRALGEPPQDCYICMLRPLCRPACGPVDMAEDKIDMADSKVDRAEDKVDMAEYRRVEMAEAE